MNARELHDKLEYEHKAGLRWLFSSDAQERETVLRALRLLAAAEANDGGIPEMTKAVQEGRGIELGCQFERERSGLAARVAELERVEEYAVNLTCEVDRALSDDGLCGREIDEILSNALAEQPAGFAAARSK